MWKLWKVDDGAYHTVIAKTKKQALAVYMEFRSSEEWPEEEPEVKPFTHVNEYSLDVNGKKITLSGGEWCDLIEAPRYLGCSEY